MASIPSKLEYDRSFLDARSSSLLQRSRPVQSLAVLTIYGLCFSALHHVASFWAADQFFSLWFPAAGLRFAFLWTVGPAWSPLAAIAEVGVQFLVGEASGPATPSLLIGMALPCLMYGVAISLVRRSFRNRRRSLFVIEHEAIIIAAFFGAMLACSTALPALIADTVHSGTLDFRKVIVSLLVFSLGDLLGILTVAIPLLWFRKDEHKLLQATRIELSAKALELLFVYAFSWSVVAAIYWGGMGFTLSPILLATCWMSFRAGRLVAWFTFVVTTLITLPVSANLIGDNDRLRAHLLLASIAMIGYLVASFAEAEKMARRELRRRDRLLYQADRLKTLRAMSVAVIHEISQPLSTIALEAQGLAGRLSSSREETEADSVRLISRKANDLSQLVMTLREFGSRPANPDTRVQVSSLAETVLAMATPETKKRGIEIELHPLPDVWVQGDDIELRQALLNLLLNAIAASRSADTITISAAQDSNYVSLQVSNPENAARGGTGMGVGLIIARAIAEAHGGSIVDEKVANQRVFTLTLQVARRK